MKICNMRYLEISDESDIGAFYGSDPWLVIVMVWTRWSKPRPRA